MPGYRSDHLERTPHLPTHARSQLPARAAVAVRLSGWQLGRALVMADQRTRRSPTRLAQFRRDGLTFEVTDGGSLTGEPVVLLHGWPGGAPTWDRMSPLLHQAGLRTLAPAQRGYTPGARPGSPTS